MSRRSLRVAAIAATCGIGLVVTAGIPAQAARRPSPPPTTVAPPPTTTPTTLPSSVPTPTAAKVVVVPANTYSYQPTALYYVQVSPSTQLADAELLTGPNANGGIVVAGDFGRLQFFSLIANSDYTFRYRNKIWIASSSSYIYSPWVQFSFRVPVL